MSKKNFDDFINQQVNKRHDEHTIDWDAKRNQWLNNIEQFYAITETFLDEYKSSGKLNYEYSNKNIFEEYIGSYTVRVLDIKLGEHKVRLEPIGTNVISADGRIDLIGVNGKIKFVLVDKNYSAPSPIKVIVKIEGEQKVGSQEIKKPEKIDLVWKIATPPPRIKYIDLDQEVFFDAILEVIGD
jgi:hypothetical protein